MADIQYRAQINMPVAPTADNHVVTKKYFDEKIQGLRWDPVAAASTENLAGVAAALTLTASANGAFPSVDGVALTVGDRVLLWQQTDKTQNGIYALTDAGSGSTKWVLTRTADADISDEFRPNKLVYVQAGGTTYGDSTFKQTTGSAVVLGATAIEFALDVETDKVQIVTATFTGDDSAQSFTIPHTFGTSKILVQIQDASGNETYFGVQKSTVNVVVTSGIAIPAGETYTVIMQGLPE